MSTHVAGAIHADVGHRPVWLKVPDDVNALLDGLWSQEVERGGDGELRIAGLGVRAIAAAVGTPTLVFDEADLRARARAFAEAFAGWHVYYAGKAFLSVAIARWVLAEGCHLDVCSGGELAVALRAGANPELISMHGNNKSDEELAAAVRHGVGRVILDSYEEIDRLQAIAAAFDRTVSVLIRVTTGVEAHTHDYIATAREDQKFGIALSGGEAMTALQHAANSANLKLLGVHSHIGSQIFDAEGFEVAARRVLRLHAQFAQWAGTELPELNLGGGFGIRYVSTDTPSTPQQLAAQMTQIVHDECAALQIAVPQLAIEPGRAICGPAACMLYQVGSVKSVTLENSATRRYVAVDGGMSDNIRTALYGADYSATLASRSSSAPPVLSRVVGKHCESGDIVVRDEYLPADLARGDLIAVPASGGYSYSMASNYNHIPRPAVISVRDAAVSVLIRRETVDDLLENDVDQQPVQLVALSDE